MALDERFCRGPSLDLLWDSRNSVIWLEHCVMINQILFLDFGGGLTSTGGGGGILGCTFLLAKWVGL